MVCVCVLECGDAKPLPLSGESLMDASECARAFMCRCVCLCVCVGCMSVVVVVVNPEK